MTPALAVAELWIPLTDLVVALAMSRRTVYRRVEQDLWRSRGTSGGLEVLYSSLGHREQAAYLEWSSCQQVPIYKESRLDELPRTADRLALELEATRRWGLLRDFFERLAPAERSPAAYEVLNAELVAGVPPELRHCGDLLRERSAAVLQRTYRLAKLHGPHRTLGRHGERKKGYGKRLSREAEQYLESIWPEQVNWSAKVAWECYRAQARKDGWPTVSYSTVRKFLRGLPADAVLLKGHGERRFNLDFAPYVRRQRGELQAGAILIGDHHQLDIMVRDAASGKLFRPWLTAWADYVSRAVFGWVFCKSPSQRSISEAWLHAIGAKHRAEYARLCGVPDGVIVDNGKDYRSKAIEGEAVPASSDDFVTRLQGLLERCGIRRENIHHALPYHARSKAIERWFRTLCEQFAKAMGASYVGNCPANRPEAMREAAARHDRWLKGQEAESPFMTFEELVERFEKWLLIYHQTTHSALSEDGVKRCPLDAVRLWGRQPRLLRDDSLYLVALPAVRRTVQAKGVILARRLEYYHPALCRLEKGTEVQVCLPEERGRIYVYELPPSNRFVCEATSVSGFRWDDREGGAALIQQGREYMRDVRARARALGAEAPEGALAPRDAIIYGVADPEAEPVRPPDALLQLLPQFDRVKPRQVEPPPRLPDLVFDEEPAPAAPVLPRLRGLLGEDDEDDWAAQAGGEL